MGLRHLSGCGKPSTPVPNDGSELISDSTDELFKSSAYLTDASLLNERSKHSALPSAAPFNLAFGVKSQFFNWLEKKGNKMRLERFGHAMSGTAGYEDGGSISQTDGEEAIEHLLDITS